MSASNRTFGQRLIEEASKKSWGNLVRPTALAVVTIPGRLESMRRGYDVRYEPEARPLTPGRQFLNVVLLASHGLNLVSYGRELAVRSQSGGFTPSDDKNEARSIRALSGMTIAAGILTGLTASELATGRSSVRKHPLSTYGRWWTATVLAIQVWMTVDLARELYARYKAEQLAATLLAHHEQGQVSDDDKYWSDLSEAGAKLADDILRTHEEARAQRLREQAGAETPNPNFDAFLDMLAHDMAQAVVDEMKSPDQDQGPA